jgi:hypothetical protein
MRDVLETVLRQNQELEETDFLISSNKKEIKNLQVRKQSLYLNFINDLSTKALFVGKSDAFISMYADMFSEIQGKFLKLFNTEMKHLMKLKINNEERPIKDHINKDIVSNMIEVLTIQTLLKTIQHMHSKLIEVSAAQSLMETKLKDMSPINLRILKQIIPNSYLEELQEQLNALDRDEQEQSNEQNVANYQQNPQIEVNQVDESANQEDEGDQVAEGEDENMSQENREEGTD